MKQVVYIFIIVLAFGCNESRTADPTTLGYDFYPIQVGQYSIYDVEEITYEVVSFDTVIYQLRETIFDSIVSIDQVSYLIRRDVRADQEQEWESDSVWSVTRRSSYLAITENGTPFIKLSFPVNLNSQWDGNGLNAKNELTYYYQGLSSAVIDSIATEDHIRVIIEDIEENITGVDLRSEIYARGIGLVEKDYLTQVKFTACNDCDELGDVIGGRSLKQTLVEIGYE